MEGLEFELLHAQEPILYVIRKQHRFSPTTTTPMADYYILAGYVYQAPDLNAVLNSRLQSSVHYLISAFEETLSYMKYHPSRGYSWDFGGDSQNARENETEKERERVKERVREDLGSSFQRRRVDFILADLCKKFPSKAQSVTEATVKATDAADTTKAAEVSKTEVKSETKSDKSSSFDGPVAKKQRT